MEVDLAILDVVDSGVKKLSDLGLFELQMMRSWECTVHSCNSEVICHGDFESFYYYNKFLNVYLKRI